MSIYETIQQQAKTLGPWLRETRRARRGYFARCDGRPEALPLDSAIFLKKSSKTFIFWVLCKSVAWAGGS
ncbi:MAG TPA: hypothetical protein IAA83_08375 [Candidatus Avoscillospira avistercoris]|uniref:Uncharacterized protein n=1 Tax=Candidatus Avoscillospira avistercoris TaxID=2840707 RepID=A0A9D1FAW1_9FIRM|nr:hypothetical protein [Candidatus Avoscillospira avistercoris]